MSKVLVASILCGIILFAATGMVLAANASNEGARPDSKPAIAAPESRSAQFIDKRALDILKRMSDTITGTSALSFKANSMIPTRGPKGIWINLFGSSRVVRQGFSMLYAETRGDFFWYDFYFDGKTVTRYSPNVNVYSVKESPGTVGELIEREYQEGGKSFPYADMLLDSPYEALTGDLISAIYVGQSTAVGVKTDHLAFVNKEVEWQIWIGSDDHLPRLVNATYLDDVNEPSYTVAFSGWKLNVAVPASTFIFNNVSKAAKVDFRDPK